MSAPDSNRTVDYVTAKPPQLETIDVSQPEQSTETIAPYVPPPPEGAPSIAGYRITAEIARGGMGRIYAAIDETLDREVAIKTLLPGADAERFVTEAKITAKLPHPAIPPVHALGKLPDGTPWLAMKLIRGQTLAQLLTSRSSPLYPSPASGRGAGGEGTSDLPRFVQIFEQIAQAVGFAHSRGIIHRDLKPLNVMVGEFGEVQVMDWGLAKELNRSDDASRAIEASRGHKSPGDSREELGDQLGDQRADALRSPLEKIRFPSRETRSSSEKRDSHSDDDEASTQHFNDEASGQRKMPGELDHCASPGDADQHTRAGTIMGTPGYMAPEQARGEVVDQRADVFALGSILATILTGQPALVGKSKLETIQKAANAELSDVFSRLDACGADAELIALCKRCLSANREDRPANGQIVATEIAAYRAGVEARLRQAEADRARAETQAAEQRKRRRVVQWAGGLIAAVLLLGLGLSLWQMLRAIDAEEQARRNEETALANEERARRHAEEAERERDAKAKALEAETAARHESQKRLEQIRKGNEIITSIFVDLDIHQIKAGTEPLEAVLAKRLVKAAEQLEGEAIGDPLMVAELQNRLGASLANLGHAEPAVNLFTKALATRTMHLGADHPDTLTSLNNLACSYQAAGKLELALPLHEETLKLTKAKLGADHPDTLRSLSNLAFIYQHAGKLDLALPLFEETLKLSKAKLGPDHPKTLVCMNNLAGGYRDAGKLELALPLLEETLRLMKAKLGPDHPNTLSCMNHLAGGYRDAGKLDLALPLFEETLMLRKAKLGPDHPDTLASMNNLALGYRDAGKLDLALPLFEETLKLRKAKLGPDHPATLTSMDTLASGYEAAGKLDLALPLFEETLKLRKAKLGPDHPDTLVSMNSLALGYRDAGQLDKALPLLEETLKLRKAKLGPDHPDTLVSMNNLAVGYRDAGQLDKALPLYEETLKVIKTKLGADHPHTLTSMDNLAGGYRAAGQLDKALPLWEETLKLKKAKLGTDHPDTLTSMNNLAVGYRAAGQLDKALPLFREAAAGMEQRRFRHQYAGRIVNNLIDCHEQLRQFDQAEVWRRKWLVVVKERAGDKSPAYAGELAALGLNLMRQNKWTEAESMLREALAIRETKEPDAWITFNTMSLLGGALLGQKKYADAEPLLLKGYEGLQARQQSIPKEGQVRIPEALERLVQLYEAVGKKDEAAKWRKELEAAKKSAS